MTLALRSTQFTVRSDVSGSLNKMVVWEKNYAVDPGYTTHLPFPSPSELDKIAIVIRVKLSVDFSTIKWRLLAGRESRWGRDVLSTVDHLNGAYDGMNGVGKEICYSFAILIKTKDSKDSSFSFSDIF